ncbi:MAG: transglutaminase family protein [Cyanobacteria bacterium P01_D01_bin.44]
MRYQIRHTTRYAYSQPVRLNPHTLRLRPRSDGMQQLSHFAITLEPNPSKVSEILDLDGNACLQVWFPPKDLTELHISTATVVETYRNNPFDYLCEPWAITAPIDYPRALASRLAPYLLPGRLTALSPGVIDFAQTLLHQVANNVGYFLTGLNQAIYERLEYKHRLEGPPQPAGVTLSHGSGTCRDFAVLFIEACQAVGLAARFVSGYQEGDPDQLSHDLHAWVEVYVPGGGWRGFDPTHGLAVSDRHIAIAAAGHPPEAAPVTGSLKDGSQAKAILESDIKLTVLSD